MELHCIWEWKTNKYIGLRRQASGDFTDGPDSQGDGVLVHNFMFSGDGLALDSEQALHCTFQSLRPS